MFNTQQFTLFTSGQFTYRLQPRFRLTPQNLPVTERTVLLFSKRHALHGLSLDFVLHISQRGYNYAYMVMDSSATINHNH